MFYRKLIVPSALFSILVGMAGTTVTGSFSLKYTGLAYLFICPIFLIIYSRAKYVLIDEPFNGIAPVYKDEIKRLIKEQSKDKGFIITDHDYRNILDVSSRLLVLHDGAIHEIQNKKELSYWGYLPPIVP